MKNYKFEIFFFVFILGLLLLLAVSARGQETDQTLSRGEFSIDFSRISKQILNFSMK